VETAAGTAMAVAETVAGSVGAMEADVEAATAESKVAA
jgi:hypothetical protein